MIIIVIIIIIIAIIIIIIIIIAIATNCSKVIFIDADQVVRADVRELWDTDLEGKVLGTG